MCVCVERRAHEQKGSEELKKRARKSTFPVRFGSFACSQTRHVVSMVDEERETCLGTTSNPARVLRYGAKRAACGAEGLT